MDIEKLKEKVLTIVPEAEIEPNKQYLTVVVGVEKLHFLAKTLKDSEETQFDYLFCLSGVDFTKHFIVVYHLTSTKFNHTIVLKAKTSDRENPAVDTVCDLWNTAEFHEREVFEMLGIKFNNHPDLRKLFLPDDWIGFPLRKDYVDPVNIVEL
jgi:NADH-quinone oxidoreductase subunit C